MERILALRTQYMGMDGGLHYGYCLGLLWAKENAGNLLLVYGLFVGSQS